MRLKKSVMPNKIASALEDTSKRWYLANLCEKIGEAGNESQILNVVIGMQKKGKVKIGRNGNYVLNK